LSAGTNPMDPSMFPQYSSDEMSSLGIILALVATLAFLARGPRNNPSRPRRLAASSLLGAILVGTNSVIEAEDEVACQTVIGAVVGALIGAVVPRGLRPSAEGHARRLASLGNGPNTPEGKRFAAFPPGSSIQKL
jgi:hypothetical protein